MQLWCGGTFNKFSTECAGEIIAKIGWYLAKIWTEVWWHVFLIHDVLCTLMFKAGVLYTMCAAGYGRWLCSGGVVCSSLAAITGFEWKVEGQVLRRPLYSQLHLIHHTSMHSPLSISTWRPWSPRSLLSKYHSLAVS